MGHLTNFKGLVCHTFIETGTYRGMSIINAAKQKFKRCFSIECDITNYVKSVRNCRKYRKIKLFYGNSPEILAKIIDPTKTTLFFLDAHYQGASKKEMYLTECPLLKELDVIKSFNWKPTILIDDANMFEKVTSGFNQKDWPTLNQIKEKLNKYSFKIVENIIYCVPNV